MSKKSIMARDVINKKAFITSIPAFGIFITNILAIFLE